MIFIQADKGAGGGAAPPNPDPSKADPNAAAAADLDYKANLLELLGLSGDATDEQITQAIATEKEIITAGESADAEEQTEAEGLRGQLKDAQDKIAGYETENQNRAGSEADAQLSEYDLPEETKAVVREHLIKDPAKGKALLAAMPKKQASTSSKEPPAPVHTPPGKQGEGKMSEQEKADAGNKLIKEVQAQGKFKDYASAREEARRRKPELFS